MLTPKCLIVLRSKSCARNVAFFSSFSFMVTSFLVILKSWHVSGSILSPSEWPRARHPSSAGPRRSRAGRRDLGLRAEPEWKGGSCGSAKRETSCLIIVSYDRYNRDLQTYSSRHPDRYDQDGQCWDGRSSSGSGSSEGSWGSHREGRVQVGRCHLQHIMLVTWKKEQLPYRAYPRTEIVWDRESRHRSIAGYPRVELH